MDKDQIIENMKTCLKIISDAYGENGGHPHRDRYTCYAMNEIIEKVSKDTRTTKVVVDEFCNKYDIC